MSYVELSVYSFLFIFLEEFDFNLDPLVIFLFSWCVNRYDSDYLLISSKDLFLIFWFLMFEKSLFFWSFLMFFYPLMIIVDVYDPWLISFDVYDHLLNFMIVLILCWSFLCSWCFVDHFYVLDALLIIFMYTWFALCNC